MKEINLHTLQFKRTEWLTHQYEKDNVAYCEALDKLGQLAR